MFKNKSFHECNEIECFGVAWENGESQDDFLQKANFHSDGDSYSGVIKIFFPKSERYMKRNNAEKDFYVEIDNEALFEDFYIPSFVDLIDFCHYIGLNFAEMIKDQQTSRRIIDQYDLEDEGAYLSITRLDNEKAFVTSYDLITTERERQSYRASRRRIREEKKMTTTVPTLKEEV
jgi:hypothetical protein